MELEKIFSGNITDGTWYPKYKNNSYNSIKNKTTQSKNELKTRIDFFPKEDK